MQPTEILDNELIFEYNNHLIPIRKKDGYFSFTSMAKATGTRVNDYLTTQKTIRFIHALADDTGIDISLLTEVRQGGYPALQGTWGHPLLAYHFAFWADDVFALWVTRLVDTYIKNGEVVTDSMGLLQEKPATESQQDFEPSISALAQLSSIYSQIVTGYKEERNLADKTNLTELRLNLTDLTLRTLSSLRKTIAPDSTPLTLDQAKSVIVSYSSTDRNSNDMVSVNQRHKELFLLGKIPRELVYEEICSVGIKASKGYRLRYNTYPSKIKQTTEFGTVTKVNCYKRSELPSIVDVHIFNLFGTLSVIDGNASVI